MNFSIKKSTAQDFSVRNDLSLVPSIVSGEIIPLKSMHEVEARIEKILETTDRQDVLAAFDIDMTLVQSIHPATYHPHRLQYIQDHKQIVSILPEDKKELIEILAINHSQNTLVEEDTPQILNNLKEKGIHTIAFTASLTGKIEGILHFEAKRYQDLQELGITFTSSFNGHENLQLLGFDAYRGNYPLFHKGILYANGGKGPRNKGTILTAFLKQVKITPKVIVMVDDKKKNLEDIEKSLNIHYPEIHFIGIEYQGTFDYAPKYIDGEEFRNFWKTLAIRAQAAV